MNSSHLVERLKRLGYEAIIVERLELSNGGRVDLDALSQSGWLLVAVSRKAPSNPPKQSGTRTSRTRSPKRLSNTSTDLSSE
jgi:hypothetical protein